MPCVGRLLISEPSQLKSALVPKAVAGSPSLICVSLVPVYPPTPFWKVRLSGATGVVAQPCGLNTDAPPALLAATR